MISTYAMELLQLEITHLQEQLREAHDVVHEAEDMLERGRGTVTLTEQRLVVVREAFGVLQDVGRA